MMLETIQLKRWGVGILLGAAGVSLAATHVPSLPLFTPAPCTEPIAYRISTVDPRFGISQEDFATASHEAAGLWNEVAGKQLLAERVDNALPVSLAFDDRQRNTQAAGRIDAAQEETEAARAQIEEKRAALAERAASLDTAVRAFNLRADAYQQEVERWNAQDGAPPAEHEALEEERLDLQREQERLSGEARSVDAYSNKIGKEVDELNERIRQINANVDSFNETAAHEFEQGLYIEDASGKRIIVYEFSSRDELVWVLAHEFGHALGLGHLDDETAVMHAQNLGVAPSLSAADKEALTLRCASR
jgi:hypothetical protein